MWTIIYIFYFYVLKIFIDSLLLFYLLYHRDVKTKQVQNINVWINILLFGSWKSPAKNAGLFLDQRYPTVKKNIFTTHNKGLSQIKTIISDIFFFFWTKSFQDWIQYNVVFDFYKRIFIKQSLLKKMLSLQNYKWFGTV